MVLRSSCPGIDNALSRLGNCENRVRFLAHQSIADVNYTLVQSATLQEPAAIRQCTINSARLPGAKTAWAPALCLARAICKRRARRARREVFRCALPRSILTILGDGAVKTSFFERVGIRSPGKQSESICLQSKYAKVSHASDSCLLVLVEPPEGQAFLHFLDIACRVSQGVVILLRMGPDASIENTALAAHWIDRAKRAELQMLVLIQGWHSHTSSQALRKCCDTLGISETRQTCRVCFWSESSLLQELCLSANSFLLPSTMGEILISFAASSSTGMRARLGRKPDGSQVTVEANSHQPFLGIGLQIRYVSEKPAVKAFDILVVRGIIRKGMHLLNTTHNECSIHVHQLFRAVVGNPVLSEGHPGDLVTVFVPAYSFEGCALCTWSDFADPIHLPFFGESCEMDEVPLMYRHCYTKRICLPDGSPNASEGQVLKSLWRAVEVDQGLRVEETKNGQLLLTSAGPSHFMAWHLALQQKGVFLEFENYHAPWRFILTHAVTARVVTSSSSRAFSLVVHLESSAQEAGFQINVEKSVNTSVLGPSGLEFFLRGVKDVCLRSLGIFGSGRMAKAYCSNGGLCSLPNSVWCQITNLSVRILALSSTSSWKTLPSTSTNQALYKAGVACICQVFQKSDGDGFDSSSNMFFCHSLSQSPLRLLAPTATLTVCAFAVQEKTILDSLSQLQEVEVREVLVCRPLIRIAVHLPHTSLHECMHTVSRVTRDTATFSSSIEYIETPPEASLESKQKSSICR
eukprot:TRINITY_DN14714_c0_g1_i1.p1 TRINITY_DN14714_c0_g1~~TRINITY_DN14714_c0_g1_i1.p1  ORF type:complete len:749 (+),score=85.31 TRINITY_DN14714_c0_g1_i1:77-2323(+)